MQFMLEYKIMIIPVNQAPSAFMKRYKAIMNGEERISTMAQLKDFWLFAIAQGKTHYEMREYIAECAYNVTKISHIYEDPAKRNNQRQSYQEARDNFALAEEQLLVCQHISESNETNVSDEEFSDRYYWRPLERYAEAINPERIS